MDLICLTGVWQSQLFSQIFEQKFLKIIWLEITVLFDGYLIVSVLTVSFLESDDQAPIKQLQKTFIPIAQLRDIYTARY